MEHLHGTPRRPLVGSAVRGARAVGALLPLLGALYLGARAVVASAIVPARLEAIEREERIERAAAGARRTDRLDGGREQGGGPERSR